MDAKGAIRLGMDSGLFVLEKYLDDLSDADLMRRPGEGCNHLAWQLGHLISSESALVNMVCPGKGAKLPEGFDKRHAKDMCGNDDASQFHSKREYLDLYKQVRQSTLAALDELSPEDLDAPGPERFRARFPTVGSIFMLIATHPTMHAGQFVPLRRQLGKPVAI